MKKTSLFRQGSSRRWMTVSAVALAAILTACTLYVRNERLASAQHGVTDDTTSLIVRALQPDDHILGSKDAPIKIMEYSDLSCPFCKTFFENTWPRLQAKYGSNIALVYRHLPLSSIHPRAYREAQASECAYNQKGDSAFWKFEQSIYAAPDFEKGLDDASLMAIAMRTGLDTAQFSACLTHGDTASRVQRDRDEAAVAGLDYTPSAVLKSAQRATVVQGTYFVRYTSAIDYLLDVQKYVPQK